MYNKVNIERLVSEISNPIRRKPKRLALLNVLLQPFKNIFDLSDKHYLEVQDRVKIIPQTQVIQHYLNQIAGGTVEFYEDLKFIYPIPAKSTLYCLLPAGFSAGNLPRLQQFLDTIQVAGFNLKLEILTPAFRITSIQVVKVSQTFTATVNVFNPKNLQLEYSKGGDIVFQSSNVFNNLTSTSIFYVREVQNPSNMLSAINLQVSNPANFNIYDVEIVKTSTIQATVKTYNPTLRELEYSIDDMNWQLSNIFNGLLVANNFYVRFVGDNFTKQLFVKNDSIQTDTFSVPSASNELKTLPIQTGANLDLTHFGTIPTRMYTDENGYKRPVWAVWWDVDYSPFLAANKKPWELGFAGSSMFDETKDMIDFLLPNQQDANYNTFTSAIPYEYRTHSQYGAVGNDEPWASGSEVDLYELGRAIGQSNIYGGGDNTDGKTLRSAVVSDVETGDENGSKKHRLFMIGGASRTKGYFISMYSGVFLELGYIEDQGTYNKKYYNYPDDNGNYSSSRAPAINPDWKIETTTSLPERGIFNVKIPDIKTVLPKNEQSFYNEQLAKQGSQYPLNTNGDYIQVNKFGTNKTVQNPLTLLGTAVEWQAWYCRYKLNNHKNVFMPKMVADRGPLGKNPFARAASGALVPDTLESHTNQQVGRKYAFVFLLNLFSNGVYAWLWDRAVLGNAGGMDTYAAAPAVIKMLDNIGAIAVFRELVPLFWETEYSLDGGVTWKKSYAIDWDTSTTDVLSVRILKSANKVIVIALRPEGVEPTAFITRTPIGGVMKYFNVGMNDWQTVEYSYRNAALADIPVWAKQYYCQLFSF